MVLAQLKIWERLATCGAPKMTFSWGLSPFFGFFYDQQKAFLFHLFKHPFCSFCNKVVQRHTSRSFSTIRLFRRSLGCNIPFQQRQWNQLEPTSMSATCLHGSCFMSTRKTAFWIQEGILFQFLKKAQLVLLSVYPTYPFTFYVNRTKRHVTWSICLSTKEWHFVFSGTQYSRDSSSSWSRSLSSPLSIWGFFCSSR